MQFFAMSFDRKIIAKTCRAPGAFERSKSEMNKVDMPLEISITPEFRVTLFTRERSYIFMYKFHVSIKVRFDGKLVMAQVAVYRHIGFMNSRYVSLQIAFQSKIGKAQMTFKRSQFFMN